MSGHPWDPHLSDLVPEVWAEALGPDTMALIDRIGQRLSERSQEEHIVPDPRQIFRALEIAPDRVQVIIVGQDPYPTPGHAMGLAFSVPQGMWPLPPTMRNILRELRDDVGGTEPRHGSLLSWHRQGVFLINRHLTTAARSPGHHTTLGWADITDRIIEVVAAQPTNPVAVLWGRQAAEVAPLLGKMPVVSSPHPSPLSAHRGFFGSRPFSRINEYRGALGASPIDWSLDPVSGCEQG